MLYSVVRPPYLQVELLVPHRIQLLGHGSRALLDLSHLNRDVGIAGAAFVFRYQALGAYYCGRRGAHGTPVNISIERVRTGQMHREYTGWGI